MRHDARHMRQLAGLDLANAACLVPLSVVACVSIQCTGLEALHLPRQRPMPEEGLRALRALPRLQALSLGRMAPAVSAIASLAGLTGLTSLSWDFGGRPPAGAPPLSISPALSRLRELRLHTHGWEIDVSALTSLTLLSLPDQVLGDSECRQLARLPLASLYCGALDFEQHLNADVHAPIVPLASLTHLEVDNGIEGMGRALRWFPRLASLQYTAVSDNDLVMLGSGAQQLTQLSCMGGDYKGSGLQHLSSLRCLASLTISGPAMFVDNDLLALTSAGGLHSLSTLRLWSCNGLTDVACSVIVRYLDDLTEFGICNCSNIGSAGIWHILIGARKLRRLYLNAQHAFNVAELDICKYKLRMMGKTVDIVCDM